MEKKKALLKRRQTKSFHSVFTGGGNWESEEVREGRLVGGTEGREKELGKVGGRTR